MAHRAAPPPATGERGSSLSPTPGTTATEHDDRASGAAVTVKCNTAHIQGPTRTKRSTSVAQRGGGIDGGRVTAARPMTLQNGMGEGVQLQLRAEDQAWE